MGKQSTSDHTDARSAAEEARKQANQKASDTVDTVQEQTSEALDQAKQQAKSVVQERKAQTADSIKNVAKTFRESSQKLRERDEPVMARYTEQTAERVEQFSHYLKGKEVDEILTDLEDFARREPQLFLGSAVAVGLAAARFFKSSSRRTRQYDRYGRTSSYTSDGGATRTSESSQRSSETTGWEE